MNPAVGFLFPGQGSQSVGMGKALFEAHSELKQVYAEMENEALRSGVDTLSPQYQEAINRAREAVLNKYGFTLEEYQEVKEKYLLVPKETKSVLTFMEESEAKLSEQIDTVARAIPSKEEIQAIAKDIFASTPPQIINKIVKEVEKPIKETVTFKEEYDDTEVKAKLKEFSERIENTPKIDLEALKEEFQDYIAQSFKKNINIMFPPHYCSITTPVFSSSSHTPCAPP